VVVLTVMGPEYNMPLVMVPALSVGMAVGGRSDRHRLREGIDAARRAEGRRGHLGKGKGGCRRENASEQSGAADMPLKQGEFGDHVEKIGRRVVKE
jgi:hypothetical protein